jgi:hypothetical protein
VGETFNMDRHSLHRTATLVFEIRLDCVCEC